MMDYLWDGTHITNTPIWDAVLELKDCQQVFNAFCNCVAYRGNKGCCSMVLDGEKIRVGDTLRFQDDSITLMRGDTEPLICPAHNVEHSGTGPYMCITTGQHE